MKVLVFGASIKTERYSNIALNMLLDYEHEVYAVGGREAEVRTVKIHKGRPHFEDIHTITLYMNPTRQVDYYDYLLSLNPKRIIFNPGTENMDFEKMATERGIYAQRACTLVLLRTNQFDLDSEYHPKG